MYRCLYCGNEYAKRKEQCPTCGGRELESPPEIDWVMPLPEPDPGQPIDGDLIYTRDDGLPWPVIFLGILLFALGTSIILGLLVAAA